MATNKQCITRLQKEYRSLLKEPVPAITAHPSSSNLLEWHFVLQGADGSEYEGGVYHGKLVFPPQYPFKPPSISMVTPNGRFATNTKLCLSMTDFHPESWNPMWSCASILNGLLSFMYDTQPTTGSIMTSKEEKVRLAGESLAQNMKNPAFKKLFPEWVEEWNRRQAPPAADSDTATATPEGATASGSGGAPSSRSGAATASGRQPLGAVAAAGGDTGQEVNQVNQGTTSSAAAASSAAGLLGGLKLGDAGAGGIRDSEIGEPAKSLDPAASGSGRVAGHDPLGRQPLSNEGVFGGGGGGGGSKMLMFLALVVVALAVVAVPLLVSGGTSGGTGQEVLR